MLGSNLTRVMHFSLKIETIYMISFKIAIAMRTFGAPSGVFVGLISSHCSRNKSVPPPNYCT